MFISLSNIRLNIELLVITFRQGFGLTSKDALNCRLCAAVKIVLGLFGPLRPSLCLPVLSTTKSSAMPILSDFLGENKEFINQTHV